MSTVITTILCSVIINFVVNLFGAVIEFILITQALMPTDVFKGLLDVNTEIFMAWIPQVNWFVPLDYVVTLFCAFIDAYAGYIIYIYVRKIIKSVLSGGGFLKILTMFLSE